MNSILIKFRPRKIIFRENIRQYLEIDTIMWKIWEELGHIRKSLCKLGWTEREVLRLINTKRLNDIYINISGIIIDMTYDADNFKYSRMFKSYSNKIKYSRMFKSYSNKVKNSTITAYHEISSAKTNIRPQKILKYEDLPSYKSILDRATELLVLNHRAVDLLFDLGYSYKEIKPISYMLNPIRLKLLDIIDKLNVHKAPRQRIREYPRRFKFK